jgi:hypothetical protein
MLSAKIRCIAAAGGILVSLGLLAAPASASTAVRPVPAALRELCAATHSSCAGHWAHLGGRSAYEISTPFALTTNGIRPLATGCNPNISPSDTYCTSSNVGGGKCWSDNSQTGPGVKVVLNNCDPQSSGQSWHAYSLGSGFAWTVANANECLNDPNGTKSAGTQQQIWTCYSTVYEEYGRVAVGPGNSQLLLAVDGGDPSSSSNACLTDNGNTASGARLVIASCNGSVNQRWVWPGIAN